MLRCYFEQSWWIAVHHVAWCPPAWLGNTVLLKKIELRVDLCEQAFAVMCVLCA